MIRISGVPLNENKSIFISLTYIFGIGKSTSRKICNKLNILLYKKLKDINLESIDKIRKEVNNYCVEGELKRIIYLNIKRLKDINSYKGIRHKKNLPVRGQRTRTNAKTKKNKNKKYKIYEKKKNK